MGKRTKPQTEAAPEEQPVAPEAAPEEESSGSSVTVTWNGGSRVYSKEVHGKDFKKLAKQFAEKFKGEIA